MLPDTRVTRELGWQVLTIRERETQDVATVERRPTATMIDRGMVAIEKENTSPVSTMETRTSVSNFDRLDIH